MSPAKKKTAKKAMRHKRSRRWVGLGSVAVAAFLGAAVGGGAALALSGAAIGLPSFDLDIDFAESVRAPYFHARRIEFLGIDAIPPAELATRADIPRGTALIDVDPTALAARIAAHPRVEHARAVRVPPDRVLVAVTERSALVVRPDGTTGIDASGVSFTIEREEATGLPALTGEIAPALALLAAALDHGVDIARIDTTGGDVRFRPVGRTANVRVGSEADEALTYWLALRSSGLIDRYRAGEVDLRFEGNAVLRDFPDKRGG